MNKSKGFSDTSVGRYSLALYELAEESNATHEIEKDSLSIMQLISNSEDFNLLINDPTNKIERQIIAKPNNINCSNAILYDCNPTVFFQPILETQYHAIIHENDNHVVRFAKFSNGTCVLTSTSPITYVPFSCHSCIIITTP